MSILEIKGVSKRFGNRQILDNLSFEVPEHSIYGFIGKNGAGNLLTEAAQPEDFTKSLLVTGISGVAAYIGAVAGFNKKRV